jgi:hypothetical protein
MDGDKTIGILALRRIGEAFRRMCGVPRTLPFLLQALVAQLRRATKGDDYRHNAAELMRLAEHAQSPSQKTHLVTLAEGWVELGLPITVEYGYDDHVAFLQKAWPDTPWHNRIAAVWVWLITRPNLSLSGIWLAGKLRVPVEWLMRFDKWWRANLTDKEREQIERDLDERYWDHTFD